MKSRITQSLQNVRLSTLFGWLSEHFIPIYTSYPQAENQPHILALSFFADTQIQRSENQKS
ncbi:MAG: hypothetical protein CL840_21280 [Crocinitomicaceae bacterium]|nr:hypothetical protein [Crocinitomicaceae bacterium]|tara:strand:- start:19375 stop:19557 length:183 start_codon:yes stop_codon:yes gene_type:complete